MFVLCEGMKWSHLPVAGGLYDQHPDLLDAFRTIFSARARHDAEEREKEEADRKRQMGSGKSKTPPKRVAGRRRH
jgi:hypothetical protein